MFNLIMKRIQTSLFIVLTGILIGLNGLLFRPNSTDITDVEELINHEQMTPQKLVYETAEIIHDNYYDSSLNHQDWSRWHHKYRNKIKTSADAKIAIDTMLSSLNDPYSRFMDKEEYTAQNDSIKSKITGIGVNITSVSGKIKVVNVVDNTPAKYANILPNDIILEIDGINVNGLSLSKVAELVRGSENTFVKLTILRNEDKIVKNVMRKEIKLKSVKSSIDKNIGYIQITSFVSSSTPNEFIEALTKTHDTNGLIIDLRGNTGGLLPNAVFIANLFIPQGNIVSIVGRNGYKHIIRAQNTDLHVNKPLVLLVDESSASASEILSGALKDYKKAIIVGTKTYGKGMVQKIIPLPNETGLNLTIAKYLTPNGTDINKIGITPDVEVNFSIKDVQTHTDSQLIEAKKIMNKLIASSDKNNNNK